jgi:amino acid transporter
MTENNVSNDQIKNDENDLAKLGYVQELFRDMGGFSNFAISFSVVSILTGLTQLYGYGLNHGGPLQMSLGWIVVAFFTMTVAGGMAELASSYPTAGALYHWSSFLGGRALGWYTACFNTIGQFAILAGIDYGLANFFVSILGSSYGVVQSATLTFGIYSILLISHAALNHFGIHIIARLNDFSAWYHIVVVLFLIGALASVGFVQPVSFLKTFSSTDGFKPGYSFIVGLLLAQWTLTGYDASAHVTEETINPRKRAPWGIIMAVVVSVIFGFLMLSALTLSIGDLAKVQGYGDGALVPLLAERLGPKLGTVMVFLLAGAMWLCGLSALTSASRMVYAFARDGGLPLAKTWAKVDKKFKTPANAIWVLAAFALVLAFSVKLFSAILSVATIALYVSYGLPIAARLYARFKKHKDETGPWSLGKFSTLNAIVAVLWVCFICVVFILPPNEIAGLVMGAGGIILTALWFGYVRKHFKGPVHMKDFQ